MWLQTDRHRILAGIALLLLLAFVVSCSVSGLATNSAPRWACPSPTPKPWGEAGPLKEQIALPTAIPVGPQEYEDVYYAEKVAIFLTFENIVGLIMVFFPMFLGTSAFPLLIRGPLCIGAAILGVTATLDVHGLPVYEQALWRARGALRLHTHGQIITPDHLTGVVLHDAPDRPLPLGGPIHVVERAQLLAQPGQLVARPQRMEQHHMIEEADHADLQA
jgi:hypothetical protein